MDVRELLKLCVERRASDLHLKVSSPPMLRVDGKLAMVEGAAPLRPGDTMQMLQDLTTEVQRQTFEEQRELDFAFSLEAGERFRVNAAYQVGTVALAIRAVASHSLSLAELGLPEVCRTLASKPHGLVLVTGPTGSGKSTTLAAMIDYINETRPCHIVTIEDPIEFLHTDKKALITQREIGADTHSFAEALRHVLRQDPDVILVGEMRDLETIAAAITAAETGHLVLATLHTNSAAQTIDRIINVFPAEQQSLVRTQLSLVLEGIISMALLPQASGIGRCPAMEVLAMTSAVRNLIREGKTFQIPNAMQTSAQLGSQTLDQALKSLVERRIVKLEDALPYATDAEEFRRQTQGASAGLR